VNLFGEGFSAPGDRGKIICPHCGNEMVGDSSYFYLTHGLSPKEEASFKRQEGPQEAPSSFE
jgi:hypothetical protein